MIFKEVLETEPDYVMDYIPSTGAMQYLYRYDIGPDDTPTVISYRVQKETDKGKWINSYGTDKWVSNTSKKRYAYPTKEEALVGFVKRKEKQL